MEQETLIYIDDKEKYDASAAANFYTNSNTKNRAYINILGVELLEKYLESENIKTSDTKNLHSIKKILEETDISDIMFDNVHIDVRVVYDEKAIFIPKSHFEYNITPDIYVVLLLEKDFSHVKFLGFFEPRLINKNNANDKYYFIEKEKLSSPLDFIEYIKNHKNEIEKVIPDNEIENSQEIIISMTDNDISENDKKHLLEQLSKSSKLRELFIEYENFETLSYKVMRDPSIEKYKIANDVTPIDEFEVFDNNNSANDEIFESIEDDLNVEPLDNMEDFSEIADDEIIDNLENSINENSIDDSLIDNSIDENTIDENSSGESIGIAGGAVAGAIAGGAIAAGLGAGETLAAADTALEGINLVENGINMVDEMINSKEISPVENIDDTQIEPLNDNAEIINKIDIDEQLENQEILTENLLEEKNFDKIELNELDEKQAEDLEEKIQLNDDIFESDNKQDNLISLDSVDVGENSDSDSDDEDNAITLEDIDNMDDLENSDSTEGFLDLDDEELEIEDIDNLNEEDEVYEKETLDIGQINETDIETKPEEYEVETDISLDNVITEESSTEEKQELINDDINTEDIIEENIPEDTIIEDNIVEEISEDATLDDTVAEELPNNVIDNIDNLEEVPQYDNIVEEISENEILENSAIEEISEDNIEENIDLIEDSTEELPENTVIEDYQEENASEDDNIESLEEISKNIENSTIEEISEDLILDDAVTEEISDDLSLEDNILEEIPENIENNVAEEITETTEDELPTNFEGSNESFGKNLLENLSAEENDNILIEEEQIAEEDFGSVDNEINDQEDVSTESDNEPNEEISAVENIIEQADITENINANLSNDDMLLQIDNVLNSSVEAQSDEIIDYNQNVETTESVAPPNDYIENLMNNNETPIEEDENKLNVLYNEEEVQTNNEIDNLENIEPVMTEQNKPQQPNKKLILLVGALVAVIAAGSTMLLLKPKEDNNAELEPLPNRTEVVENNTTDNSTENILETNAPEVKPVAESNVNKQTAVQELKNTQPKSTSTAYMSVSKVVWDVPDNLSYSTRMQNYLRTAGKSIKLTLSTDLLLATEYAYTNHVKINMVIGSDGSVKSSAVSQSSGSSQIDKIVLQSVKETLNVIKPPSEDVKGKDFNLNLIIYF